MTEEQSKEFRKLMKPVVEFINANYHPNVTIVATCNGAELLEGLLGYSYEFDMEFGKNENT